jgi:ribosome-associated toxin RatA of RatAB toxin-antitoxin module
MKTIRHELTIACPQETLFDLTQDYTRRLEWDPYLIEARLLHGAEKAAVGVEAFCKNRSGSGMVTRYITFNRPIVAAVTMTEGPRILERFSGAWNVRALDTHRSTLTFTYNFTLRGGALGKLLTPIASQVFSRDMKLRMQAIKSFVEKA